MSDLFLLSKAQMAGFRRIFRWLTGCRGSMTGG